MSSDSCMRGEQPVAGPCASVPCSAAYAPIFVSELVVGRCQPAQPGKMSLQVPLVAVGDVGAVAKLEAQRPLRRRESNPSGDHSASAGQASESSRPLAAGKARRLRSELVRLRHGCCAVISSSPARTRYEHPGDSSAATAEPLFWRSLQPADQDPSTNGRLASDNRGVVLNLRDLAGLVRHHDPRRQSRPGSTRVERLALRGSRRDLVRCRSPSGPPCRWQSLPSGSVRARRRGRVVFSPC